MPGLPSLSPIDGGKLSLMNVRKKFTSVKWGMLKTCGLANLVDCSSVGCRPSPASLGVYSGPGHHLLCEPALQRIPLLDSIKGELTAAPEPSHLPWEKHPCKMQSESLRVQTTECHQIPDTSCDVFLRLLTWDRMWSKTCLHPYIATTDQMGSLKALSSLEMLEA